MWGIRRYKTWGHSEFFLSPAYRLAEENQDELPPYSFLRRVRQGLSLRIVMLTRNLHLRERRVEGWQVLPLLGCNLLEGEKGNIRPITGMFNGHGLKP